MTIYQRYRSIAAASSLLCLLALVAAVKPAFAQTTQAFPFVDPLFTDNMVLQRGVNDNVWGWTTPGQSVTVQIDKKSATAVAGPDGKWLASIGPFKAGGPYTLTITGPQTVTINNVLIGDVWVCSGQSNMEFGIGNGSNATQEIAAANYPNLRIYTVNKATALTPQALTSGQWQPVTSDSIAKQGTWNGFTAVGYFFGRDLQSNLKIPIGLIQSSWGGTVAEAWTSKGALAQNLPEFAPQLAQLTSSTESQAQLETDWYAKNDPGTPGNWQDPNTDTSTWKPIPIPSIYQQAGIPELAGINGILWFRYSFDLPAADTGKDGVVHIMVDDNDSTWVNGTLIGATEGYNVKRSYALPANLLKPTGNVIVVRDTDTGGGGGIWGDAASTNITFDGGQDIPLAATWQYRLAANYAQIPPFPSTIANNPNFPTTLYNGMISPLQQFPIKGALWYQGESNAGNPQQYRTLLPTMINDWRTGWNEGNFPFLIVQLAGWQPGGPSWAELRQAQWLTAQNVPNTGIVTAIDVGDQSNIHPTDKQDVGMRLALVAEAMAYGQKVSYSGPVYKSATTDNETMKVSFTQTDGGLTSKDGAPLAGFEIAGADGKFVAATATTDGKDVVVSSPDVPSPVAVQYDWSAYPGGNLYNKAGLPAFPFKSDEK
jgi:sialate O-acetylesterase